MRVLSAQATNFASYKEIDFDFTNQGLTLIQGQTGSGKSTLCDLIPWILFGVTAKGGSVSDVLSWPGDEVTKGCITVLLGDKMFQVLRSRGKAKDNDLMIWEDGGAYRGKDLIDTQRIINEKLGMNAELYLAGAYYHEFSQTAQFFTANAKTRRLICEQLVDLSLAKKLSHRRLDEYSTKSKAMTTLTQQINTTQSNIKILKQRQESEDNRHATWNVQQESRLMSLQLKYRDWDSSHKHRLVMLEGKIRDFKTEANCPTCGSKLEHKKAHNPYIEQLDRESSLDNPYVDQILELNAEVNPYSESAKDYSNEIKAKEVVLKEYQCQYDGLRNEIDELDALQQIIEDYRSVSITNTISNIETETNRLLTEHFDSEIQVSFDVADADKLDVTIHKDGNQSNFSQLSKGQRGLLKLCFGVSVMQAVQNHHGLNISTAWFDESLDGLSDSLKIKAVNMLGRLTQYESVFVVEHSETVKAMVDNKYNVELVNGSSQIERI